MANIFNSIRVRRPKRHKFNLSHEVKLTCNIGDLVPVEWQEVIPGDTFSHSVEALVRFQALMAPMMHRIDVYFHHFFVPNRLIWDDWEDFITGGEDGYFTTEHPQIRIIKTAGSAQGGFLSTTGKILSPGSLADFMGVPTLPKEPTVTDNAFFAEDLYFNALPFRAYQLIYNEWYRDQNLQDEIVIDKSSGVKNGIVDLSTSATTINPLLVLRKRNWHKDYFTSALPFTQRGPEVKLPIRGSADIIFNPDNELGSVMRTIDGELFLPTNNDTLGIKGINQYGTGQAGNIYAQNSQSSDQSLVIDNSDNLRVDLSSASSSTVNELRRSLKIQEWLERSARGGARYIEQILSHFGVMGKDARLQRPQYLGGSKSPVSISEVVQNSATGLGDTPQGNLAGKAIGVSYDNGYKHFFDEHGIVMTIMSIIPKANYQQGLPRKFQRRDKFDYYFPEFAHLGEQPIFKSELFYDFTKTTLSQQDSQSDENAVPFGYTPRYAEYKCALNRVHGQFKDTLAFWHMGRIFDNAPGLNGDFVTVDGQRDGLNRVFATQNVTDAYNREIDKVEVQLYHNIRAKRPMPVYGTPMI